MAKSGSGSVIIRAALFSSVVAYVLMGSLLPLTPENPMASSGEASRRILTYFALTALGVVLFPRMSIVKLGLGIVAMAGAVELIQLIPALGHTADELDVVAAAAGVVIALGPAVIGREFPLQPKGASPTSLNFLP